MLIATREFRLYKESLRLDPVQKNLIIGSLFGDGNLRFVSKNREATFIVDHGYKQKDYVLWKYDVMKDWVLTEPKVIERLYHKDPSRKLTSFRFSTISHPELTFWYNIFYKNGRKIIPENVAEILKLPLSLAVWFMDDGNKNKQAVFLNTQQFSIEEQELLRNCLFVNFGLETTINKHWVFNGKQLYRIRINTKSTKKLYAMIKDFVLPSMQYKFPLFPVTTSPSLAVAR